MHLNEFLFILFKTKGFMKNYYLHLHYLIFKNPIWMNFYRTNILYYHFYEPAINLSDHRDLIYINDFFKAMNIFKRIQLYLWRKLKSPYKYYFKELRYNEKIEQEFQENPINFSFRSDYEVKEAFGPVRDYKMIHYRELLKFKYNTWLYDYICFLVSNYQISVFHLLANWIGERLPQYQFEWHCNMKSIWRNQNLSLIFANLFWLLW